MCNNWRMWYRTEEHETRYLKVPISQARGATGWLQKLSQAQVSPYS